MCMLWVRALLATAVALDRVVHVVHGELLEDNSSYQACLVSPSSCPELCAAPCLP